MRVSVSFDVSGEPKVELSFQVRICMIRNYVLAPVLDTKSQIFACASIEVLSVSSFNHTVA